MANKTFTEEYKALRKTMSGGNFANGNDALLKKLKILVASDGPDRKGRAALSSLRALCEQGFFQWLFGLAKDKEAAGILSLAGSDPKLAEKAAALKTLRHLHLMRARGGHETWVLSLPDAYKKWLSDEFAHLSKAKLTEKLLKVDDRFSSEQKKGLADCTQQCTAWCLKASAICSQTKGVGAETAATLIKRWFGDASTTDADVEKMRKKLAAGYGQIAGVANGHKLVLTDNPIDRGKPDEQSNAYVWYDTLKVVYIEGGFFGKGGDPLIGLTNWTRIMVHELSHLVLKTDDHRYRHQGILPKANKRFNSAQAINNADSWAFFAADANGVLSQRHRNYCLK